MNESERQKVAALAKRYREAGKFREADAVTFALLMCKKPKKRREQIKPLPTHSLPKINSVFQLGVSI